MSDDTYTKETIDLKLQIVIKPITDHLEKQDETLAAILTQVKNTNGRVTSLEKLKTGLYWGGATIIFVVVPLIIYIWNIQVTRLHNVATELQTLTSVKDALTTVVNNESK